MRNIIYFLLIVHASLYASLSRHNEQGLSATHSYKGTGPSEVISNQNGNLVLSDVAADISRTPLGIQVGRSFNSHWRNPLHVHQLDLNFDNVKMNKDGKKPNPEYKNMDNFNGGESYLQVGTDPTKNNNLFRRKKYHVNELNELPKNWQWLAQTVTQTSRAIYSYSAYEENKTNAKNLDPGDKGKNNVDWTLVSLQLADLAIRVTQIIQNWDEYSGPENRYKRIALTADLTSSLANSVVKQMKIAEIDAPIVKTLLTLLYLARHADDFGEHSLEEWIGLSIELTSTGVDIAELFLSLEDGTFAKIGAAVNFASAVYNLYDVTKNGNAWDPGHDYQVMGAAAQVGLATAALSGAPLGPGGIAASIAIQVVVTLATMIDAEDNAFDLMEYGPEPWAMGVNGYVAMMGNKYESDYSKESKINNGYHMSGCESEFNNQTETTVYSCAKVSAHPMSEMNIIKTDGSAERYILNANDTIYLQNASPFVATGLENARVRWHSYTALSNTNQTQVLYADFPPYENEHSGFEYGDPELGNVVIGNEAKDSDPNDFYMVKEPNGTVAIFGRGNTKGIDRYWTEWDDPYEMFWALPNEISFFDGDASDGIKADTITIKRDAGLRITRVDYKDPAVEPRYVTVDYNGDLETVKTFNGQEEIHKVVYKMVDHEYNDGKISMLRKEPASTFVKLSAFLSPQTAIAAFYTGAFDAGYSSERSHVRMVEEIRNEVGGGKPDLVTKFEYSEGNLKAIDYPNGSRGEFLFNDAKDKTPYDGFCFKKILYATKGDLNGTRQVWEYVFNGWAHDKGIGNNEDPTNDENPKYLETIVQSDLYTRDVNDRSKINFETKTDLYRFNVAYDAVNIKENSRFTEYNVDPLDTNTQKESNYITTRIQLVSQILGSDGTGFKTDFFYNGDQLIKKIERKGRNSFYDPVFTVYQYDDRSNMVLESFNTSSQFAELKMTLVGRLSSYNLSGATGAETEEEAAAILADIIDEVQNDHGLDLDDIKNRTMDRVTIYGYYNDDESEFYRDSISIVDNDEGELQRKIVKKIPNTENFNPYAKYVRGVPSLQFVTKRNPEYPVVANAYDPILGGSQTSDIGGLYGTMSIYDSAYIRVSEVFTFYQDSMYRTATYEYNDANNPYIATGTKSWIDEDNFTYSSIELDDVFHQYPAKEHAYKETFAATATPGTPLYSIEKDYNAEGLLEEVRAPGPNNSTLTTTFEYDDLYRPTRVIHPDDNVETTEYFDQQDGNGYVRNLNTMSSGIKTYAYFDGIGRVNEVKRESEDGSNSTSNFTDYGIFGKLRYGKDANGREVFHDYDKNARLIRTKVPKTIGNRDAFYTTSIEYDDFNYKVVETDQNSIKTTFYLNKYGQTIHTIRDLPGDPDNGIDPKQYISSNYYDNLGNLVYMVDPKEKITTYEYDHKGVLLSSKTPEGIDSDFYTDRQNRLISGTQTQMATGLFDSTAFYLDGLNRIYRTDLIGPGAGGDVYTINNIYDETNENGGYVFKGNLVGVQKGDNYAAFYKYNNRNLMSEKTYGVLGSGAQIAYNKSLAYEYSPDLILNKITINGNFQLDYGLDYFNRMSSISYTDLRGATPAQTIVNNVLYKENDLMDGFTYGNGTECRQYFDENRPYIDSIKVFTDNTLAEAFYRQTYNYDEAGNIIASQRHNGEQAKYDYDNLYRLKNVTYGSGPSNGRSANIEYTYDLNGNRTKMLHDFGRIDMNYDVNYLRSAQSKMFGKAVYQHDYRGNRNEARYYADGQDTTEATAAWYEKRSYGFNKLDEMTTFKVENKTKKGAVQEENYRYTYDENGLKVLTEKQQPDGSWKTEREYINQGVNVIWDKDASENFSTTYVPWGLNKIAGVRQFDDSFETFFYHNNHLGTLNQVTDGGKDVVARYVVDPYGNVEYYKGDYQSRYIYTAKEWVPELQQFYFGQRYYDPALGIWNARDKLEQFHSPYAYTGRGNNPLISRDADGWAVSRDMPSFYAKSGLARFNQGATDEASAITQSFSSVEGLKGVVNGLLVQFTCMASNSLAACQPVIDGMVESARELAEDPWYGSGKVATSMLVGRLGGKTPKRPSKGNMLLRKLRGTKIEGQTTAIGRMDDLAKYDGYQNVDTWRKSGRLPGAGDKKVSWTENRKWLDERIKRGDTFIMTVDPKTLPDYVKDVPNGSFTKMEYNYLVKKGATIIHDY